jgi:hypothetical protein
MENTLTQDDHTVNFSLGSFLGTSSFHKLFDGIKHSLQSEQKELVLGRKDQGETESYFNFMKFLFSSPDRAT